MATETIIQRTQTRRQLRKDRGQDFLAARLHADMSQAAVAKAAGISAALLSRIEHGHIETRPERWIALYKIIETEGNVVEANQIGEAKIDGEMRDIIIRQWTSLVESSNPQSDERRVAMRGLRRAHGFSQKQLAEEHTLLFPDVGMDQTIVSFYEKGLWEVSEERGRRLYEALRSLIGKSGRVVPPSPDAKVNPHQEIMEQLQSAKAEQQRLASRVKNTLGQVAEVIRELGVALSSVSEESERKAISTSALEQAARLVASAQADTLAAQEVVKPAVEAAQKLMEDVSSGTS